jgi:ABC-type branched-subunit amino acid transport system substrate-binding protein
MTTRRTTRRSVPLLAIGVAMALVTLACGNSSGSKDDAEKSSKAVSVDAPGVSDTEIRVGGIASITNPLGGKYDEHAKGVEAYFAMVNADGGIDGRKLKLAVNRDDAAANNSTAVQQVLSQDDVFAVMPVATLLFTGADKLVDANVPTFGWNINQEWGGTDAAPKANLFGQYGSFLCFTCASPLAPYVAQQAGATKIGLLAYNVPQSADCATGVEASFEKFANAKVVFADKAMAFGGGEFGVQVSEMKKAGVDLVLTCMDLQGVVTLAREMKRQSLDAVQYLPNGYDPELLADFGDLFQGSYLLTFFTPFEMKDPPKALTTYLRWMEKTGAPVNENTMNGWLNAALFVEGLRKAGKDFSRQKVIDAINAMDDWNADGLLPAPGVDWTQAHTKENDPSCGAVSRVDGDAFEPVFGKPGKPFVCIPVDADDLAEATITD